MNLLFHIAGYWHKHTRTGGWAISCRTNDSSEQAVLSGAIEIGYNQKYCDAYPVLRCLILANDIFFRQENLHELRCNVSIYTDVAWVERRINKEWNMRDRIKNFVRINPWDKIREHIVGLTFVEGLNAAPEQLSIVKSFAQQSCERINSVTEK